MVRFQISLEYILFAGFFIVAGVFMFRVLYGSPGRGGEGGIIPLEELNTSAEQLIGIVGAEVIMEDGGYVYNVSQQFNTNKTIFGMRIWPDGMEDIFGQTAINYSVTFLATGEVKKIGPFLPGSSLQKYDYDGVQDPWFEFKHITYSDGIVVYQFYSSVMEDYLS